MGKVLPYTKLELKLIHENYNKLSTKELTELLNMAENNNRTQGAIKSKLNSLGLKRNERNLWTNEEIEILNTFYNRIPVKGIQRMLQDKTSTKRSIQCITSKAKTLGLTKTNYSYYWTNEEKEIISNTVNEIKDSKEKIKEPQESQKEQKEENYKYRYLRKYINEMQINLLIDYSIKQLALSDIFIANSLNMPYKDFKKAYNCNNWSIEESIKVAEFLQNYFIAINKTDVRKLYTGGME